MAYKSYVRLKKFSAETAENNCSQISNCINNAMIIETITDWFLCKLQANTNTDLRADLVMPEE